MAKHRIFPFKFKPVPKPAARNPRTLLLVSPIEDAFWKAHMKLKLQPLAGLVRQYPVRCADRRYKLDFALPRKMIGIELDGHRTHSSTAAIAADRRRQRDLEAQGWYIIRFGGLEVYQDAEDCVYQAAQLVRVRRH